MKFKFLFVLGCCFLLTGCFNYSELNNLSIATGMSIDKDGEDYVVGMLISNAKKSQGDSGEGQSQTIVLEGKGSTILEAIRDIELVSPNELYLRHLVILVISEDVAKDGVYDVLDYLFREPQSRKTFYVILSRDVNARDTLKIVSPLESFPSMNIAVNIKETSQLQAIMMDTTYNSFLKDLLDVGKNPCVNSVMVEGSVSKGEKEDNLKQTVPDANIKMGTLGVFKDDKLLGWTDKDENRGISILLNNVGIMYTTFDYKDGMIGITFPSLSSDSKVVFENHRPVIEVKVTGEGMINEVTGKLDLEDYGVIEEIEEATVRELKKYIDKGLDVLKNTYQSDILGYGNMIYKSYPDYFKRIEASWDSVYFPDLEVRVSVDISINLKGSLKQSIKEVKDE